MPPKSTKAPEELTQPWAAYEYARITKILGKKLLAIDHSLIIDYCQTYADVIQLRADVEEQGHTLMSDKGNSYINPTTNLLISRQSHLAALRRDLYFTPRTRIDKPGKDKKRATDALDEIDTSAHSD